MCTHMVYASCGCRSQRKTSGTCPIALQVSPLLHGPSLNLELALGASSVLPYLCLSQYWSYMCMHMIPTFLYGLWRSELWSSDLPNKHSYPQCQPCITTSYEAHIQTIPNRAPGDGIPSSGQAADNRVGHLLIQ